MDALDGIGIESALAAQAEKQAAEDEVGQNDFLQMLVAQLENQDPLNPQDSAAFASQLAQFSSVEQLVAMRAGIDTLVASASNTNDPVNGPAAASLDPTNLVGKDVVVFGSQIEVDEQGSVITMPFRSIDAAIVADVRILDANGQVRYEESLLPTLDDGDETYLEAGDHTFRFDPGSANLPPGVYAIEFTATGTGDEEVTLLPMIEGRVTGAILAGEPSIRMGNRIFSVNDVLEVRMPNEQATRTRTGSGQPPHTGGGQTVYDTPNANNPTPTGTS